MIDLFSLQRFNKGIKNPLQKHSGNEEQRERPDVNMTETWVDISVPETWRKLDRIAKTWYNTFPQIINVAETWNSMFQSHLRNSETWDFVLCHFSGIDNCWLQKNAYFSNSVSLVNCFIITYKLSVDICLGRLKPVAEERHLWFV